MRKGKPHAYGMLRSGNRFKEPGYLQNGKLWLKFLPEALSMSRRLLFASLFLIALSNPAQPQSPTDGQVQKTSYENSYFKFSYSWPSFLQPFDVKALQLSNKAPSNNEFLLFSARQGEEPYGIVLVAERMNVPGQHSGGLKSSSDLIDKIARFRPEQHVIMQPRKHFTNTDGRGSRCNESIDRSDPSR